LLNSTPLRTFAYSIALAKGGVPYKRFTNWTIAALPLPPFQRDLEICKELVRKSKEAHKAAANRNLSHLKECEAAIDELVFPLLGLTRDDLEALGEHHQLLSGIVST